MLYPIKINVWHKTYERSCVIDNNVIDFFFHLSFGVVDVVRGFIMNQRNDLSL